MSSNSVFIVRSLKSLFIVGPQKVNKFQLKSTLYDRRLSKKLELAATLCDKRLVETKHGLHFREHGSKRLRGGWWIPAAGLTIVIIIVIATD